MDYKRWKVFNAHQGKFGSQWLNVVPKKLGLKLGDRSAASDFNWFASRSQHLWDPGRFGDIRFGNKMATDFSATKCRRNVFVAETSSKKLKPFVLEAKII